MHYNWSATNESHVTRCSQSCWLVLVGVNECILIKVQMVRNSGKTNTFLILWSFLLGSISAFLKSHVFLGWVLRILWSKVVNNFAVPKIRVFLGPNLRVLWSEVMNNFAVPKICVYGELSCWGRNLE